MDHDQDCTTLCFEDGILVMLFLLLLMMLLLNQQQLHKNMHFPCLHKRVQNGYGNNGSFARKRKSLCLLFLSTKQMDAYKHTDIYILRERENI